MSLLRSFSGRTTATTLLALAATQLALAQNVVTVFNDDFSGGSTVNSSPTAPANASVNAAAYQVISGQAQPTVTPALPAAGSVLSGNLRLALNSSVSTANITAQAIFSKYPVKLANDEDYIELTATFTAETALLTDSANTTGNNANLLYFGLYGSSGSSTNAAITKDNPDSLLSNYVHEPNPALAGGKTDSSSNIGNNFSAYWRGYTARIARTGGRHQAYYQNSSGAAFSGNSQPLNPVVNSTLAPLTAGQQYTAVFRIRRDNVVDGTTGAITTRLYGQYDLYSGAAVQGTPVISWSNPSNAWSSSSQHMGVVFDALALGFKVNANIADGFSQIMAINSVKVVTTGNVIVAPAISDQPDSQSVEINSSATLSVVASGGNGPGTDLTYQWRKDGFDISGAIGSSYNVETAALGSSTYSVVVTSAAGSTTSNNAVVTVTVPAAPTITTHPAEQPDYQATVQAGSSATFKVTATGSGLSYQWQKSTNGGTSFTDIPGATSATYTIAATQTSSIAQYRAVVTNSTASVPSNPASLNLTFTTVGFTSSGYASSATGGGSVAAVVVNTADAFKTQAESTGPAVITVSGNITLSGKVSVKSDKTIQGIDGESTVIGNLELASGVSNVVIRGLNITNPSGIGVTINGASNVYINHVSFYDFGDTGLSIVNGANNITVSWSEFYYTAATATNKATVVGASTETKPIYVTFDHNWWGDNTAFGMPDSTYGRIHMYNNLVRKTNGTAMNNISGPYMMANAQLFSERNQFTQVNSLAIAKDTSTNALIRTLGNTYTSSSGIYAGGDFITFAPSYGYQLKATSTVTSEVMAQAGNISGAATPTPTPVGTASITGTATSVPIGGSFTLTADTTGLTLAANNPLQWRRNGYEITGANAPTYTASAVGFSEAGTYAVAATLSTGEVIVSTPYVVTTVAGESLVPSSESEGSDAGGGSPSLWFLGSLGILAALRRFFGRQ